MKIIAITMAIVMVSSGCAFAGPIGKTRFVSRGDAEEACAAVTDRVKTWGLTAETGAYGCQNLVTGQALFCTTDGQCRDYVGDPRWANLHDRLTKASD